MDDAGDVWLSYFIVGEIRQAVLASLLRMTFSAASMVLSQRRRGFHFSGSGIGDVVELLQPDYVKLKRLSRLSSSRVAKRGGGAIRGSPYPLKNAKNATAHTKVNAQGTK